MRGGRRVLVAIAAAGVFALTGCADESGESSQPANDETSEDAGDAARGDGRVQAVSGQVDADDRDVIYTADLVVQASLVEDAAGQAVTIAEEAGGLLFEQRSDLEGEQETDLVLKVPPDQLDSVLGSLSDLGNVLRRDVSAEDVTDQVVDLDGRLQSAEASAERLRGLLADAPSTAALIEIEGELARRESEIESLEGQLRVLTDQVELATINLRLTERADLEVSDDLPGFLSGLHTGWVALVTIVLVLVVIAGFLLPFVPIAGAAWWVVRRYLRSPRRRAVAPN